MLTGSHHSETATSQTVTTVSQHTFTIATSEQDISQLPGIIHPLYEGCVLHPDQTPLTIDMYVHSKTLVDARVD